MTIFQTAHFTVKPESLEKCKAAIQEFIDYVKANEPGTLRYTSLQESGDPHKFMHFFIFQDEAAQEIHRSSPGVTKFTGILYPELASNGVTFTEYAFFAST